MRRDSDKYQFKEPFGREIRKKMMESQKKVLQGPEKYLKLGQLKPTMLATVGHVATGVFQPVKKQAGKQEKKQGKDKDKEKKKGKKKGKKEKKNSKSKPESADEQPVEKKAKKGDSKSQPKQISDISLVDFDKIRNHFPGMAKKCFILRLFNAKY